MSAAPIVAPPYGSPEWLRWRNRGLGASEFPSLTGDNPWASEYQLAALKRGMVEPDDGNAATRWGHRLEAIGIEHYMAETGLRVVTGETFANTAAPHAFATLDGRVPGHAIGVEVKSTRHRWEELPRRVVIQCLAQMGIAELAAVDVVVLPFPLDPFIVRVDRDEEAIADLLALGEEWWARYVEGDEMPPLDESPAARKALGRLRGDEERIADDLQRGWLHALRSVRADLERLETAEKTLLRTLKSSMAGAGVLMAPDARVTWSAVKPRTTTDWRAVAMALAPDPALIEQHTTTGDPGERFAVKYTEALEEAAA